MARRPYLQTRLYRACTYQACMPCSPWTRPCVPVSPASPAVNSLIPATRSLQQPMSRSLHPSCSLQSLPPLSTQPGPILHPHSLTPSAALTPPPIVQPSPALHLPTPCFLPLCHRHTFLLHIHTPRHRIVFPHTTSFSFPSPPFVPPRLSASSIAAPLRPRRR